MGSGAFLVAVCRFLAELLVRAWHAHNCVPKDIPPDEDEILHARRIVAQRCLYGVDKNPMAVDLAKLSLWLATLAKDHPFTFLDHALKCGDSLVGLTKAQIVGFHWKPDKQRDFARAAIEGQLGRALEQRRQIREAPDGTSEALLRERLTAADGFVDPGRRYGDLVVSAFFSPDNDRRRRERLESLAEDLAAQRSQFDVLRAISGSMRPSAGFEADLIRSFPFTGRSSSPRSSTAPTGASMRFVGNPPFAGKNTMVGGHAARLSRLAQDDPRGVARQRRPCGPLLSPCFRPAEERGGLRPDRHEHDRPGRHALDRPALDLQTRRHDLRSDPRKKWPGQAAVIVSVVHVPKGAIAGAILILDGRRVSLITAYLFHAGGHDDPAKLKANEGKSFQGSIVLGMGFTFDDTDTKGVANPIAVMHRLIEKDPRNAERIFPYIGGEEVNDSPTHAHHRYVINFGEMSEEEARRWPDLMRIVEERVKPNRMKDNRESIQARLVAVRRETRRLLRRPSAAWSGCW